MPPTPSTRSRFSSSAVVFVRVTLVTNDMLDCARAMFLREEPVKNQEPEILMEITMKNLLAHGELDLRDFLDRVDMLGTIGTHWS